MPQVRVPVSKSGAVQPCSCNMQRQLTYLPMSAGWPPVIVPSRHAVLISYSSLCGISLLHDLRMCALTARKEHSSMVWQISSVHFLLNLALMLDDKSTDRSLSTARVKVAQLTQQHKWQCYCWECEHDWAPHCTFIIADVCQHGRSTLIPLSMLNHGHHTATEMGNTK